MTIEREILLAIHAYSSPALDALFLISHVMGAFPFCTALVVSAAVWHLWRGERREAALWLVLGLSTLALQSGLKELWDRPRPALWTRTVPVTNYAFPSGHALASATFYPLLAWAVARRVTRCKALCYALAVGTAFFIGFGRLYLGVHWPTDVLCGWALGAAQTGLGILWLGRVAPSVAGASQG